MAQGWFLRFRASRAFLYVLAAFVGSWMGCHWLLRWFDPELGGYNSILSTEASLMLSLCLELQLASDSRLQTAIAEIRSIAADCREILRRLEGYAKQEAADLNRIEEVLHEQHDALPRS